MATRTLQLGGKRVRVNDRQLRLKGKKLTSLAFLEDLPDLEELTLEDNGLASLRDLPRLPKLRALDITRNPLTDLAGIDHAPALERLFIDCKVKKPQALGRLPRLQVLMMNVVAADLRFLGAARALTYLSVSGPLRSLRGLEACPRLGELLVHGASLQRLEVIEHAPLWKLFMNDCGLTRVPQLKTPRLLIASFEGNAITDVQNVKGLPKLRDLNLSDNPLTHLSGLTGLPALAELDLDVRKLKSAELATDQALRARPQVRVGHTKEWPKVVTTRRLQIG
jgi:protein phosphatase 1 regulatory subunit 7